MPGFFLGTIGGVLIDRLDRRKVMVVCDIGRASLLLMLPFIDTLFGLVLISFGLEILTLLWGPAKDASVPHLVNEEQLASANTLSLVASYGTFPLASIVFSLLAALAAWLGSFDPLRDLAVDQEALALVLDACTFLLSAFIVFHLPIPKFGKEDRGPSTSWTQTLRDIREGIHFIAHEPLVRGIIVGLGLGLIGGGAMIPLGPVFAKQGLNGDAATFGVLMTALGVRRGDRRRVAVARAATSRARRCSSTPSWERAPSWSWPRRSPRCSRPHSRSGWSGRARGRRT